MTWRRASVPRSARPSVGSFGIQTGNSGLRRCFKWQSARRQISAGMRARACARGCTRECITRSRACAHAHTHATSMHARMRKSAEAGNMRAHTRARKHVRTHMRNLATACTVLGSHRRSVCLHRHYIGSMSASPTASPLRGYGRAGTENDRLGWACKYSK